MAELFTENLIPVRTWQMIFFQDEGGTLINEILQGGLVSGGRTVRQILEGGTVGGRSMTTIAEAINTEGNFVRDVINARLDTSAKTILSDFTFSPSDYSGAFKTGDITWNTITGAITGGSGGVFNKKGLIFANNGLPTIILDGTTGNATFAGTLSAVTGTFASLYTNATNAITIDYGGNILLKEGGSLKFTSVTAPTACTTALAGLGAGNVDNGTHYYKITYITASGETELGAVSNLVTVVDKTVNGQVALTAIPVGSSGAITSRKIYRTKAGGFLYFFLATINDNSTTVYTDNIADASLGVDSTYRTNNTFGKIIIDGGVCGSFGNNNTFLGILTGYVNTTGREDTGVGQGALRSNTIGYYNTAVGSVALFSNTIGYNNTAVGVNALTLSVNGYNNTAVGMSSLGQLSGIGRENVAIGVQSLFSGTNCLYNVAIGNYSGYSITTDNSDIFIGYCAGYYSTESNVFYLDDRQRANTATEKTNALLYGIMADAPANQTLNINAVIKSLTTYDVTVSATNRDLYIDNTGLIGYVSSSIRYKENVKDLGVDSEKIYDLRPVSFDWKKDKRQGYGLIAEETIKVFPYLVSLNDKNEPESVEYNKLIPFLLNEVIKLHKEIKSLKSKHLKKS